MPTPSSASPVAEPSRLQHHFDDLGQQLSASTMGMWVFLVTEILFIGGLFALFAVYNSRHAAAFEEASRELDVVLGTTNTAVLLTSSFTVALAVRAARAGRRRALVAFLGVTLLLALAFLVFKFMEYHAKFEHHLVPGSSFSFPGAPPASQLFFSFYFVMTGMHALHVVVGFFVLGIIALQARKGKFTAGWHTPVEMGGLYWHFVDIVWIWLFPVLYLIDRS